MKQDQHSCWAVWIGYFPEKFCPIENPPSFVTFSSHRTFLKPCQTRYLTLEHMGYISVTYCRHVWYCWAFSPNISSLDGVRDVFAKRPYTRSFKGNTDFAKIQVIMNFLCFKWGWSLLLKVFIWCEPLQDVGTGVSNGPWGLRTASLWLQQWFRNWR